MSVASAMSYLEMFLACAALILLFRKHLVKQYKYLAGVLFLRLLVGVVIGGLIFGSHLEHGLPRREAYQAYFYLYWVERIVEILLIFFFCGQLLSIVYSQSAMRSLIVRLYTRIVSLAVIATVGWSMYLPHLSRAKELVSTVEMLERFQELVVLIVVIVLFVSVSKLQIPLRNAVTAFGLGLLFIPLSFLIPIQQPIWLSVFVRSVFVLLQTACWIAALYLPEPISKRYGGAPL